MPQTHDVAKSILNERFGKDSLIALATADENIPSVRTVNAYYEDSSFYIITWSRSGKMQQIKSNPNVAVSGDWFTAHGVGENLGHVLKEENLSMLRTLRRAFSSWYSNGHVDENSPETVLLRIRLTDGVLFSGGTRYELHFPL